ncbi:MAG: MFS transporter [Polyangia bacterium]
MSTAPSLDPEPKGGPSGAPRGKTVGAALREVIQPIRDFARIPRALSVGVNLPYFIEGLVYFGTLTVLTKYLSENVALGDIRAGHLTALLTGGITAAMFVLGELGDRWGARRALLCALSFLLAGRVCMALGETLHLPVGSWRPLMLLNLLGMSLIITGYGSYQPTAYAAVKQYTDEKTAAMGYAMLYALANLGAFASGLVSPWVRHRSESIFPPNGITGVFWMYVGLTVMALLITAFGLPRQKKAEPELVARALTAAPADLATDLTAKKAEPALFSLEWIRSHPLWDAKFAFFIFVLIPVQTLFAHGWLTLPLYIERAFRHTPWVSQNFEFFSNLNPLLIFVLTPLLTALTARTDVYKMMIIGTAIMAAPTLLLTVGPSPALLLLYTLTMSIGEAMWQPRFLQYVAEIAPPGKTGMYMGVAQLPWFLTKLLTGMYSGWFLKKYCPAEGPQDTQFMWLVYSCIAMASPICLFLARGWVGRSISQRRAQAKA